MKLTASTHPGCRSEQNQDYYRAGRMADDTFWMVLCDGMGGVTAGGVASELATEYITAAILRRMPDLLSDTEIETFLMETALRCNEYVFEESQKGAAAVTMGTTLVMAVIRAGIAHIVHAGDSRMYLMQKNGLKQLTRDHSIVQELLDAQKITPEQAYNHPNKNIITSALGIDRETRIEYNRHTLSKGEMLLCCSDGLSNMLRDGEIAAILRDNDFYQSAELLVKGAVDAGGYDNITAIVLEAE